MTSETTSRIAVIDFSGAVKAIELAGTADSDAAVAASLGLFTSAMGMERYTVIDCPVSIGGEVAAVYHNAPNEDRELGELTRINSDPLIQIARSRTPMPFTWDESFPLYERSFYSTLAAAGYRSGIAASCQDSSGGTVIVIASSSRPSVPDDEAVGILGLASTLAAALLAPLAALRPPALACPLTQREKECVICVLAGMSTKQTARHLGIAARTIGQYLERARTKLGAPTSLAAGTIAIRRGWISLDEATTLAEAVATPARRSYL